MAILGAWVCPYMQYTAVTDLEDADWTREWIFFQLPFLVEKLARPAVCRETVETVVETVLQVLPRERAETQRSVFYLEYKLFS